MKKTEKSVDGYLAALPADEQKVLKVVRDAIRSAAPDATEKIAYQVPVYFHNGWLLSFKAGKNFLSLITMSREVVKAFAPDLKNYELSGTSIHFSPEQPLSGTLVKKIVKMRLVENAAKRAAPVKATRRKRYAMPAEVKQALIKAKLMPAYLARPPYQQNDYLMWIEQAKQQETKQKRLNHMLAELKKGNIYMNMQWNKGTKQ